MDLSDKQISIMTVIIKANDDGSLVDLDQILERLDYTTTKQSLQFSLRALIGHGVIQKAGSEKRRNRVRTLIRATQMGKDLLSVTPVGITKSDISLPEPDFDFDTEIEEILVP